MVDGSMPTDAQNGKVNTRTAIPIHDSEPQGFDLEPYQDEVADNGRDVPHVPSTTLEISLGRFTAHMGKSHILRFDLPIDNGDFTMQQLLIYQAEQQIILHFYGKG